MERTSISAYLDASHRGGTLMGCWCSRFGPQSTFTICTTSRYSGPLWGSYEHGRIFQGSRSNWLHGHWNGRVGVAHYVSRPTSFYLSFWEGGVDRASVSRQASSSSDGCRWRRSLSWPCYPFSSRCKLIFIFSLHLQDAWVNGFHTRASTIRGNLAWLVMCSTNGGSMEVSAAACFGLRRLAIGPAARACDGGQRSTHWHGGAHLQRDDPLLPTLSAALF